MGILKEFHGDPLSREMVVNRIISIIDAINIQPVWHPMHSAFWYTLIEKSEELRKTLNDLKPGDLAEGGIRRR